MHRNGLSLRRKTIIAQKDPAKLIDRFCIFLTFNDFQKCIIINHLAELQWTNRTVDPVGAKSMSLKTTFNKKVMVSVCWAAKANGTKLKPMIVFMVLNGGKPKLLLKSLRITVL